MPVCPTCKVEYEGEHNCTDFAPTAPTPTTPTPSDALVEKKLEPGFEVGEYVIQSQIGAGGFGTVYAAIHPVIKKRAAIKVLDRNLSSNPHFVSRFVAEARSVNEIQHPNIIDIFGFGELPDGRHYYVMEYMESQTLEEYLEERGSLPLDEAFPVLRQIGLALDAAHEKGIVHRDLKPANIMLGRDLEGRPQPKLLDFGIAKLLDESVPRQHKTATGAPLGTPQYMSPEQSRGDKVDHRTDIYSFGVLTYEVVSGKRPFEGESSVLTMMKHISEMPPPPSEKNPSLPPELDACVMSMLVKDPNERPQRLPGIIDSLRVGCEAASGARASTTEQSLEPVKTTTLEPDPSETEERLLEQPTSMPRSTPLVMLGVVVVAVVAIVLLSRDLVTSPPPVSAPATARSATVAERSQEIARPQPQPDAAVLATITLTIVGKPKRMVVSNPKDGVELGPAPGNLEISSSTGTISLKFHAAGYRSEIKSITPNKDQEIRVRLRRLGKKKKRQPETHRDLETPIF